MSGKFCLCRGRGNNTTAFISALFTVVTNRLIIITATCRIRMQPTIVSTRVSNERADNIQAGPHLEI